jgi:hypothetical protein
MVSTHPSQHERAYPNCKMCAYNETNASSIWLVIARDYVDESTLKFAEVTGQALDHSSAFPSIDEFAQLAPKVGNQLI